MAVVLGALSVKTVFAENIARGKSGWMTSTISDLPFEKCTDGDYADATALEYCKTNQEVNPEITVDLGEVSHVGMIAVFQIEVNAFEHRLVGSELRVGNSLIATENPGCGVPVDDGGFYDCGLWGRYVTLRRTTPVNDYYGAKEIAVWPQTNICPLGEAS